MVPKAALSAQCTWLGRGVWCPSLFLILRVLSHSHWHHSLVQDTQPSPGRNGKVKAFPHDSSAHLMPTVKVVSQKGWTHLLHTAMSLWPLSSFTQLTASQDTWTVPEQERDAGPVSASQNQPPLTPSAVTSPQCRQVSKSHRLSSEQPSSLDPSLTSQLWKPKLPYSDKDGEQVTAVAGMRAANSPQCYF